MEVRPPFPDAWKKINVAIGGKRQRCSRRCDLKGIDRPRRIRAPEKKRAVGSRGGGGRKGADGAIATWFVSGWGGENSRPTGR